KRLLLTRGARHRGAGGRVMDVERLREHLASEYGIVVSNDDPIFAAVALNELAKQILGDALRAAKQEIVRATPCPPAEDHHAHCQSWKAATVVASLAAVVGWRLALILVVG
ncbi:hypothetical protein, partial [Thiolapillus sp.]|uniref:hypothetical protein n=2 Tax=Thiolapillus sp. TaxID=2017437 RepID=UPI003AF42103